RGADAAEFPVTAQGGGDDLFGLGGLRPDVVPDRDGPGDDVVAQPSQAFGLDLDHVPRPHGTRVGGGARQQHVARVQGDRAGDVGGEVVHVQLHLVGAAVLDQLAVDVGPQVLAAEVPVGDEAGPKGAERVGALDPEHRARVGVAEVVQAVVVGDGVAGDVRARVGGRDVAAGPADDDRDLALVVEVPAPFRADDRAPVGVERRDRL